MNTRYETERDLHDLHEPIERDREISLGTTTILGMFFALAMICAVFFGFGYSLGRKTTPPAVAAETVAAPENNLPKPSPGSAAAQSAALSSPDKNDKFAGSTDAGVQSTTIPLDSSSSSSDAQSMAEPIKPAASAARATRTPAKPAVIPVGAVALAPGSPVVQVAAMSHQEDADVVAVDLKRRGYAVAIRRVPQDKLFHVQIGPFASKKDADTMRTRLQGDGYNNAIVK